MAKSKYEGQDGRNIKTKLISFKENYSEEYDYICDKYKVPNASQYLCELIRADMLAQSLKSGTNKDYIKAVVMEFVQSDEFIKLAGVKLPKVKKEPKVKQPRKKKNDEVEVLKAEPTKQSEVAVSKADTEIINMAGNLIG